MQNNLNHGHHLFIDNCSTSISLPKYLLEKGTHVTGTIRENRNQFCVQLKELNLEKGEAAHYQHEGIVVTKYRAHKDKATGKPKIVYVLSTAHSVAMGNTSKRDRDGNIVQKPTSIITYNHNMGGVDIMDQQLDAYEVLRKSYKWYKKLFLRLVMQCSLSAHKLYKMQGGKAPYLNFLLKVCNQLLTNSP